jgi:predicted RNA binding protein YcfA (HicA-like mRNA interferase family)
LKLPTDLSGQYLVKALLRVGFAVNRQRGSHIILRRSIRTLASLCLTTNESAPARFDRF